MGKDLSLTFTWLLSYQQPKCALWSTAAAAAPSNDSGAGARVCFAPTCTRNSFTATYLHQIQPAPGPTCTKKKITWTKHLRNCCGVCCRFLWAASDNCGWVGSKQASWHQNLQWLRHTTPAPKYHPSRIMENLTIYLSMFSTYNCILFKLNLNFHNFAKLSYFTSH